MAEKGVESYRNVQGAHDVLSNFFLFDIKVRGKLYKSAEHAYQAIKANHHKYFTLEAKIEHAYLAVDAKLLSKPIVVDGKWLRMRSQIIKEILEEKASQCWIFRECLIETGDSELRHTVDDLYWGTGLYRGDGGKNVFGELLMEIRREIASGLLKSRSQKNEKDEDQSQLQRKRRKRIEHKIGT